MFCISCSFTLLVWGNKNILPNLTNSREPEQHRTEAGALLFTFQKTKGIFCMYKVIFSNKRMTKGSVLFLLLEPNGLMQGHNVCKWNLQGADLKTIKQRNKNLIKNVIVLLLNNFIWTNRKEETILYLLSIGRKKLFIKKTIIFLMRLLFRCFIVFKIPSQVIWSLSKVA